VNKLITQNFLGVKMNIFVGNLSNDVGEDDLMGLFSEFGQVREVKIIRDMFSQQSKGFGFVEMPGLAEAQKAINELNTKELKGKKIVVNEARPKRDSNRRPGGGGGGGNRGGSGGGGGRSSGGGGGGGGQNRRRF
jgi:RNA recognition motif-containing protein